MKTAVCWLALCGLAIAGCWARRLDVALLAAGVKAGLVGLQFMELGEAARNHAYAWLSWAGLVTGVLLLAT